MAVASQKSNAKGRVLPDLSNVIPSGSSTNNKTVDRSGKARLDFKDNLTTTIMEVLEPLIKAIDDKPALLMEASSDTGHASQSSQDMGMKIMLGTFLQFLHRQNHGPIIIPSKDKTGKVIGQRELPSNKERMDDSQRRLNEITDLADTEAYKTMYYASVNEERFVALEAFRHSFAMVYREVFNEDWKPMNQAEVKKIDPVTVSPEEKDKWAARLASMKGSRQAA